MPSNDNGLISFAGPVGRTYHDRDGVLQTAGKNEIREEYDPLTGAYCGMLIEPQERTNHLSEPVDLTKWGARSGASISETDRSLGPGYPVYLVDASAESDSRIGLSFNVSEGPGTYVLSLYVATKSGSLGSYTLLSFSNGGIGRTRKQFSVGGELERVSMPIEISDELSGTAYIIDNREDNSETEFLAAAAQLEKGTSPSSFLVGSLPGEDARFNDPAVFNNFEHGAFYIEFKTKNDNVGILSGAPNDGQSRLLNVGNGGGLFTRPVGGYFEFSKPKPQYAVALSLGQNITPTVDGENFGPFNYKGIRVSDQLLLCGDTRFSGSAHIKTLDFNPTPYTDAEARQITKRDAATVVGDAPSGGYYDYSDLSTMLVESDESGIPVEDRKIARVGDPIGAILDKSGHGNHLTASTDSRRGVLRFDGENYYIERDKNTIYGFDFSGDYSLTVMIALQNYSDRFIVLCDQDGGSGNYAMIYDASTTNAHLRWSDFGSPHYYANGEFTPASNRGDTGATLQTNPIQLRTLHRVADGYSARIFVGGYTSSFWDLTGEDYGLAWASRLSEDDAALVEQEMKQNMPSVSA